MDAAATCCSCRSSRSRHLLLLAGLAGGLAILPARGCLRPVVRVRRLRELPYAVRAARILPGHGHHGDLLDPGRVPLARLRAAARHPGRQEPARRPGLQDAADLALCGRARHRGRPVDLHVPSRARHAGAADPGARHRLEPAAQRQPRHGPARALRHLEADQLQLPVLPRRPAGDPQERDRGGGHRRRRARCAASGRSSSRFCRRRRSSCSSSTSSTCSSTRSASSTR